MNLLVLRHAEAVPHAATDAERGLTEKGAKQAKTVGRFCVSQGLIPGLIFSSPLVRARDTAQIVASCLEGRNPVRLAEELRPGMTPERGLGLLRKESPHTTIMLVGHEPDLTRFCANLLGAEEQAIHLRKAGLVSMSLAELKAGTAILEFLLPVKFL